MDRLRKAEGPARFQPGERRLVALLFLEYFFLGVTSVFTQSAVFALFLADFGSEGLPYSYLAAAVGASSVAFLYLKISERFSLSTSLIINLGTLALVSVLVRFGLNQPNNTWLIFALPVWFQIIANLSGLALWTLASRLLDVRQGKRLFGFIGAGNWLAVATGGFFVAPIVAWLGTPNLFLLAGLALAAALGCQIILLRENRHRLIMPAPTRTPARAVSLTQGLVQNRYLLSILLLVGLVWIGFFFIDNIFYDVATAQITDVNQLASFIGTLNAAIGVIGLLMTIFLTGPVISRLGIGNSLLVLPGILTITAVVLVLTGTLGQLGFVLFALAAFSKAIDVSLTFTLDLSARAILYQPLPVQQRARIQTIADGIVQPISIGIAGVLLLVFNTWLAFDAVQLSLVFLVVGTVWILVALALRRQYPLALAQALAKRHLGETPSVQPDRVSVAVLQQALENPHAGAVIYAANLLQELEPNTLADAIPNLLAHPLIPVRRDTLDRVERLRLTRTLPTISGRLASEPSPELRGLALRTLARLGNPQQRAEAATWIDDPSSAVRRGAIVGLLDGQNNQEQGAAERALQEISASSNADERALAAEILGEIPRNGHQQLLLALLNDRDIRVQRSALNAVNETSNPEAWDVALAHLSARPLRRAAMAAFIAGKENVLPLIEKAFNASNSDPQVPVTLARICGRIGGPRAVALLKAHLDTPNPQERTEVLAALCRLQYHVIDQDAARVLSQIRSEVEQTALLCTTSVDIGQDPTLDVLNAALNAEIGASRERVFYLLSFLYDRGAILNAHANLSHATPEKRAYALEVLDVLLPHDLKAMVFPVAEGLTPAQCLTRLASAFPQPRTSREARLREMSTAANPLWNPWLQANARYAMHRLGLASNIEGGQAMFSTIEKVIILKGVDIFAETPDTVLADVAEVSEEIDIAAGETIFNKGDVGDSLYVIVSGRVRVHDGPVTLNELGEADVFGEMALLDPEPRLASVTAVQDTRLLRVAEQPFQELLQEQSEIARSIITVLTRRLRARVQDLTNAVRA